MSTRSTRQPAVVRHTKAQKCVFSLMPLLTLSTSPHTCHASRLPRRIRHLITLCRYYHISADYVLGLSQNKA
ncbi:MAG: hypothetical protein ACI4MJ_05475 [Aristaeellaceae bacterium]